VRFDLYRADSARIRAILGEYTDLVEPLSLDEAFLDVSASGRFAWDIAKEIRARIFAETSLTASAGVAPNKMLAKIASDWRKPNGQFAVRPEEIESFMAALPVRKIWGIGPKSAERFAAHGIHTCADLQRFSLAELVSRHGKWGEELYQLCRGQDDREVRPNRVRKSLSNENTFLENLVSLEQCETEIEKLAAEMLDELRSKAPDRRVRKAFVKVRFADFSRTTRECVCSQPDAAVFRQLLGEAWGRRDLPVRLLGTGVRFAEDDAQPDLFLDF
jgi:DNA polymerase-4